MQIIIIIVVALSVYALVQEYKINQKKEDGTNKYSDEEKKFRRKDYIALIKFLILLMIAVSIGSYFFGSGDIDYSRYSEGNYMRP